MVGGPPCPDGSDGLMLTVKKGREKEKNRRKGKKMASRNKKPSKGREERDGLGRAGCEA